MEKQLEAYAAFESVPDALLVVGREGLIVSANQHAGRLFGYEPGQLVGLEIEALIQSPSDPGSGTRSCARSSPSTPPLAPWEPGGNCAP